METQQTTKKFSPGDHVQYMHIRSSGSGSGLQFSTRRGRIAKIDGADAIVNVHGRKHRVRISELTHQNQPSPVNRVFNALAAAAR